MGNKLKVTLVRSLIGNSEKLRRVVQSLGLRKINSFVLADNTPSLMGKINKVAHLVKVEEVK